MNERIVLRLVSKFLIPFIIMYGLYVQLHGEYSPGGGFQAGVILAAAFILYALIFGVGKTLAIIPLSWQKAGACLGVLLYGSVGVVAMYLGGNFLNYSVLHSDPVEGQKLGILLIELGVGLTVCTVMMMAFFTFASYHIEKEDA